MTTTIATPAVHAVPNEQTDAFWAAAVASETSEEAQQAAATLESKNLKAQQALWFSFERYFMAVDAGNDAIAKKRTDVFLRNNPLLVRLSLSATRAAQRTTPTRKNDPHYVSEWTDPQILFTSTKLDEQGAYLSSHPEAFAQWQAKEYKPGGYNYGKIVRQAARARVDYLRFHQLRKPISGRNRPSLSLFARFVRTIKRAFSRFVSPKLDVVLQAQRLQIQVNANDLQTAQKAQSLAHDPYNAAVKAHQTALQQREALQTELTALGGTFAASRDTTLEAYSAKTDENTTAALAEVTTAGNEENTNPLNDDEKTLSARLLDMRLRTEDQTEKLTRYTAIAHSATQALTADIRSLTDKIAELQQQRYQEASKTQLDAYQTAVTAFQAAQTARRTAISDLMDAHNDRRSAQAAQVEALKKQADALLALIAAYPERLAALIALADVVDPGKKNSTLGEHAKQKRAFSQLKAQLSTVEAHIEALSQPDQTSIHIPQDAAASSNLADLGVDTEALKNEVARLKAEAGRVRENTAAVEKKNASPASIQDPAIFSRGTIGIQKKVQKLHKLAAAKSATLHMDNEHSRSRQAQQRHAAQVAAEKARISMDNEDSRSSQVSRHQPSPAVVVETTSNSSFLECTPSRPDHTARTEASELPCTPPHSATKKDGTANNSNGSELPCTPQDDNQDHISYTVQDSEIEYTRPESELSFTPDADRANLAPTPGSRASAFFPDSLFSPNTATVMGHSTPDGKVGNFGAGTPPSPITTSVDRTTLIDNTFVSPLSGQKNGKSPLLGYDSPLQTHSRRGSSAATPVSGNAALNTSRRSLWDALNNAAATPASSSGDASGIEYTSQSISLGAG